MVLLAATAACSGERESESERAPLSGVTALSMELTNTCALLNDGTVSCWGFNSYGELGIGRGETSEGWRAAAPVDHLADAIGVAVAERHACAALADGSVECWGTLPNRSSIKAYPSPPRPAGVRSARAVVASRHHTCALLMDGTVQCWGATFLVNLGDPSLLNETISPSQPVSVVELSDAKAIMTNTSTVCALLGNGEVKCWGLTWVDGDSLDDKSSAGRTFLRDTAPPKSIEGLPPAVGVALGHLFGCAVLEDTTVACWGLLRENMGGTEQPSVVPTTVADLSGAIAIAAGDSHACVLLTDGSIRCWGLNLMGQLGDGSELDSAVPVRVQGIDTAVAIAAGNYGTCAILADSTVRCWGMYAHGCSDSDGRCPSSAVPVVMRAAL
jgi:alpha-tubulin suppressor-like RCC1 family protein